VKFLVRHYISFVASFFGLALLISVIVVGLFAKRFGQEEKEHGTTSEVKSIPSISWEQLLSQIGELRLSGDKITGVEIPTGRKFEIGFEELLHRNGIVMLIKPKCSVLGKRGIDATLESGQALLFPQQRMLEFVGDVTLKSLAHAVTLKSEKVKWWWEKGKVIATGNVFVSASEGLSGGGETAIADIVLGEIELANKPYLQLSICRLIAR